MAELRPPQTIHDYPGLFYHAVTDDHIRREMDRVRVAYLRVADVVLNECPPCRERSLALTYLEDSLGRAIQALAVRDPAYKVIPLGFED